MGRLFLERISRDAAVVMGILMMIATAVVLFQLIADILWRQPDLASATHNPCP
jgi:ABC-type dipeptide/oligopeptide/nickel transport system permease component